MCMCVCKRACACVCVCRSDIPRTELTLSVRFGGKRLYPLSNLGGPSLSPYTLL